MMNWQESSVKLLGIMKEKAKEIRKTLPPSEKFIEAAAADLVSSGIDFSENKDWDVMPKDVQISMIMSLVDGINQGHADSIRNFIGTLGEVLEMTPEASFSGDSFLGEEDSSIIVLFERTKVRIDKDLALKILTLGQVP